ncbi:MAG: Hsp20/alpha crystallin family protein [Candidatus Melainabacteria bacterium]|nr:Hsp20/alpha crystallin family protein [Candidatus Melainabacteria bacterium]
MALLKWKPLGDIERIFDEDFPSFSFPSLPKIGWDLAVDMYEENSNYIAEMNLPGIDPDKVEVSVEDDHLKISGTREEEKETEKKNYYCKEIRRGSFERVVNLPASVKKDKVEARYADGVLRVILPKETISQQEKVKVRVKK